MRQGRKFISKLNFNTSMDNFELDPTKSFDKKLKDEKLQLTSKTINTNASTNLNTTINSNTSFFISSENTSIDQCLKIKNKSSFSITGNSGDNLPTPNFFINKEYKAKNDSNDSNFKNFDQEYINISNNNFILESDYLNKSHDKKLNFNISLNTNKNDNNIRNSYRNSYNNNSNANNTNITNNNSILYSEYNNSFNSSTINININNNQSIHNENNENNINNNNIDNNSNNINNNIDSLNSSLNDLSFDNYYHDIIFTIKTNKKKTLAMMSDLNWSKKVGNTKIVKNQQILFKLMESSNSNKNSNNFSR